MTSKMMGHQMQRCMEDSDSDEEESMPRLMGSVGRARNVYRNTSKKASKVAMMRGMSSRKPSAPQPTSRAPASFSQNDAAGLGGVMVALAVRDGPALVRFQAKPFGELAQRQSDRFASDRSWVQIPYSPTDRRPANPHRRCNLVATDILSSAGAGAPPGPLLVPLPQKSSAARGPRPRRVIALEPHPHSIRIANKTFPFKKK